MIAMDSSKFVTAINCMDGRVQDPINTWLKQTYHATFVDVITEPGPIQYLATSFPTLEQQAIKKRVEISVKKHGSTLIAVIGHHDCGGNPASRETQHHQIQQAINTIKSWEYPVEIIGLYVDDQWTVHQITENKTVESPQV